MTYLCLLPRALLETCTMAPSQRSNCGFPGVTPSQCAEKGCCFDSTIPGYPWCFHPLNVKDLPEGRSMAMLWALTEWH